MGTRFRGWLACVAISGAVAVQADPIFPNSVVSNDLDFITGADAGAYACQAYQGQMRQEMPGQASGDLFADGVWTFQTYYTDGTQVPIWVHPDLSRDDAVSLVDAVAERVGKLPSFMRAKLDHVVINAGDDVASAEDRGRFFVLTHMNIAARISTHDLEETIFHEAVHATLDIPHASSVQWRAAQRADGAFITDYAARLPDREDLAESALFAYAMTKTPGRLPAEIEEAVRGVMPARLAYLEALFTGPTFTQAGPAPDC